MPINPLRRAARRVKKTVGSALGSPEMQSLTLWQQRLERARQAAAQELSLMDWREDLYLGTREIQPGVHARRGRAKQATTVRNIVSELIESQIDSNIPKPKVDATDPADEARALAVERTLLADINRLPVEYLNDEQERTNPIQGGSWVLVEWDNSVRTHTTVGDTVLTLLHPKQVFLQPGVRDYRRARWAVCSFSVTKDAVLERFGVDVDGEIEEKPEIAVATASALPAADTGNVTLHTAYYLNDGGVGLFAWVGDTVVADYPDYHARRASLCEACGRAKSGPECPCGSRRFKTAARGHEELAQDVALPGGAVIPALSPVLGEGGAPVMDPATGQPALVPTRIPYYRLNTLPLVLRKNVSVYGKLLGESDVDRIADMQERIKKLSTKIDEKLLKGGSYITLKHGTSFELSDQELKVIRVRSADEAAAIRVQTLQPNISLDAAEIQSAHYAAKETLGITDSYQGLPDKTATSGVAKQFAAQQSAGRLESKRRMKDAAWAEIYRLLFQFKLAYADEPRPWAAADAQGRPVFGAFSRYEFLKRDAAGEWYYEDRFLFSVDSAGGLMNNREAMWQETRMNYQTGAFGAPGSPDSLVLFWSLMESLHYPKAGEIRRRVEQAQAQQAQAQQMQQMQAQAPPAPQAAPKGAPFPPVAPGRGV